MTDPTRHGKSDPEIQRMLDILLKRRGEVDSTDDPLIGKYADLFRDPHGQLAGEILASMPENERKLLMDEIEARIEGWNLLRPKEKGDRP